MIKNPLVAFVVLNWNEPELTLACLRSLRAQDYANTSIFVVDNGSIDNSVRLIREQFPQVIMIENSRNLGYSEGNNVGISAALKTSCDYIFLLNNDTEVDPSMLTKLLMVAEGDQTIGIAGPSMFFADPPDVLWAGEVYVDWFRGEIVRKHMWERASNLNPQAFIKVDNVDTCAALIRREVFETVGLMDAKYFINFDDFDLNVRARKGGYKVVHVPSARMWHKVSATMGQASPATTYYMTRNALYFFARHAPLALKSLSLVQLTARTMRSVLAWTFRRQYQSDVYRRRRLANLLGLRDFLTGRLGRMGTDVEHACYGQVRQK